ncbi:hypothetical protein KIL84_020926 [Mauremys mutica]|uniref:Uncharacterized protein n=1 Tax=Mauremys mutica TaxID=74926 RepID=A0A9D3XB01_9SAUR|nr:hypothetical protein KIL84_020926 [Mauremys mutica]
MFQSASMKSHLGAGGQDPAATGHSSNWSQQRLLSNEHWMQIAANNGLGEGIKKVLHLELEEDIGQVTAVRTPAPANPGISRAPITIVSGPRGCCRTAAVISFVHLKFYFLDLLSPQWQFQPEAAGSGVSPPPFRSHAVRGPIAQSGVRGVSHLPWGEPPTCLHHLHGVSGAKENRDVRS